MDQSDDNDSAEDNKNGAKTGEVTKNKKGNDSVLDDPMVSDIKLEPKALADEAVIGHEKGDKDIERVNSDMQLDNDNMPV